MKKKKLRKILKKTGENTAVINRTELIKQLRRMNLKKSKIIQPKKGQYDRKDKSWKKEI